MPKYANPRARLAANSTVDENTGCWNWTAGVNNNGRPRTTYRDDTGRARGILVTQFILRFIHKQPGMGLHRCHNYMCVRPEHVYAGTAGENNRDIVDSGRHVSGWHYHNEERRQRKHLRET